MNLFSIRHLLAFAIAGTLLASPALAQKNKPTADDLLISAQKTCPVSGGDLRAMGVPVKAKSGDQIVFLCCKECLGKPISKANWAKTTANLVAAQGHCPVMNRPLPVGAASVIVSGRRIFVCCPPCTGKIQANPNMYLPVVDAMLSKNVGQK